MEPPGLPPPSSGPTGDLHLAHTHILRNRYFISPCWGNYIFRHRTYRYALIMEGCQTDPVGNVSLRFNSCLIVQNLQRSQIALING